MFNRIEVSDSHRESGERPCTRPATGPNADAIFAGPFHKVRDDEVITRESLARDHLDLVFCAFFDFRSESIGISIGQSGDNLALERRGLGVTLFDRELRHVAHRGVEFDVAPLGNKKGVVGGLGVVGEQRPHLGC
ncbi:unannotated protein [freshwater metagenome]|uniref:Unannotated protein n=1 Tax=freshwater metagenome TaxID=449393 RepID=A0A6J6AWJ7_9ZZZZ